ncbi:MAG: cytidylate kinase family protein [Candidatus Nanoarchaeia archaeon]
MIVTISGLPGSGKTCVAKLLAKKLGFKFFSMGDIVQKFATDKGMTLLEFNKLRNEDPSWDVIIDTYQRELGKKNKNAVFDGLTSFHIFPKSVKIFLKVKQEVGARRIFKAKRPDEPYKSFSEALKAVRKRIKDDKARYTKIYGVNCHDTSNFDFIVDTSNLKPNEVVKSILGFIKKID